VRFRPRVFAFASTPIDTPTLSPFPTLPLAHRLGGNDIGAKGATALAAILKETQITNLRCAAARAFAFVAMPADTFTFTSSTSSLLHVPTCVSKRAHLLVTSPSHSVTYNYLDDQAKQAIKDAAGSSVFITL
jgi:hypothetical protein